MADYRSEVADLDIDSFGLNSEPEGTVGEALEIAFEWALTVSSADAALIRDELIYEADERRDEMHDALRSTSPRHRREAALKVARGWAESALDEIGR